MRITDRIIRFRRLSFVLVLFSFATGLRGQVLPSANSLELCVSHNIMLVKEGKYSNNSGLGIGFLTTYKVNGSIEILCGLEVNLYRQFRERGYGGHMVYFSDMTYTNIYLILPLGIRTYMNQNKRTYLQGGGFGALFLKGSTNGQKYYYDPFTSNPSSFSNEEFEGITNFSNTAGIFIGVGRLFPISDQAVSISVNFKNAIPTESNFILRKYQLRFLDLRVSVYFE